MSFCCTTLYIAAAIATPLIIFKIVYKFTIRWCNSYTSLVGKTTIVTGANTGIGYVTALDFAKRGARVILACRNKDKAEEARLKIIEGTGNENVIVKLIDMTSFKSVREFAKDINSSEKRLDILVNNAGAGDSKNEKTIDGNLFLIQVNYLSPVLLTILLIDLLKKSGPSRIVHVASSAADVPGIFVDLSNLNAYPGGGYKLYSRTKLCNVLFTIELAKKVQGTGITTYSLHPGVIKTDFFRNQTGIKKTILDFIFNSFFLTSEEGAQTTIYTALERGIEKYNGEVFANCRKVSMYKNASDPGLAKKLWEKTETLLQLKPEELQF